MTIYHLTYAGVMLSAIFLLIALTCLTVLWIRPRRRCRFCGALRQKTLMEKRVGLWFCGEGSHHWFDWQELVGRLQEQASPTQLEHQAAPLPIRVESRSPSGRRTQVAGGD